MRLTKKIPRLFFSKHSFLDFPVNLGIVGKIISECTRPQTTDQPANCSEFQEILTLWKSYLGTLKRNVVHNVYEFTGEKDAQC